MAPRLVPVMQPATETAIPAALHAVTNPASAPVSRAMVSLARRLKGVDSHEMGAGWPRPAWDGFRHDTRRAQSRHGARHV